MTHRIRPKVRGSEGKRTKKSTLPVSGGDDTCRSPENFTCLIGDPRPQSLRGLERLQELYRYTNTRNRGEGQQVEGSRVRPAAQLYEYRSLHFG